jgi:predicted nucleotidyltransferase
MSEPLGLIKSKLRRDLLRLYFTNPDKEYYLRELERMINFSVGNIRRELMKLESKGLFTFRRQGNLVYYSLNKSHPLFKALKSLIFKTIGVEGELRSALRRIKGIELAFIYGSFAKGDERTASDIDLFIMGNMNEEKLIRAISKAEIALRREINYSLYSREDFEKKKKEKDYFIKELIREPKVFLIGDDNGL